MSGLEFTSGKGNEPLTFKSPDAFSEFLAKCRREFNETWKQQQRYPTSSLSDWERLRTLGSGAYGRVILVKNKTNGHLCVIKVLEKAKLVRNKQLTHLKDERQVLNFIRFPFLLHLIASFKNFSYIFFVLPFIAGGEMFSYLKRVGKFEEEQARFYATQVVLSLEYLHNIDLVHRDLKPENILIDEMGYLKIADMGFCTIVKSRKYSFCGTPEYIAPEIINSKGYGKAIDWWMFGVLLYEMTAGYPPFSGSDPLQTYDKIVNGRYREVAHLSTALRNLIENLLQADLSRRYGNLKDGVNDIKNHSWFRRTDWLAILNKQVEAPYVPRSGPPEEACNFDRLEEEELKEDSIDQFPNEFKDF